MKRRLTADEARFFSRQLVMDGWTEQKQLMLLNAHVVIVGLGGIGAILAQNLWSTGIGHLTLIDHDSVQAQNLHRQVLYTSEDVGKKKVECARDQLMKIHSFGEIHTFAVPFAPDLLQRPIAVVCDGVDDVAVKRQISQACIEKEIPIMHGAANAMDGQWALLNAPHSAEKRTAAYIELFAPTTGNSAIGSCEVTGILPAVVQMVALNMSMRVIRFILEGKTDSSESLHQMDFLSGEKYSMHLPLRQRRLATKKKPFFTMQSISVQEVKEALEKSESFTLLDVREPFERDEFNFGGIHIPMGQIPNRVAEIPSDKPLYVYCRSGMRSGNVAAWLEQNGFPQTIKNVEGGIMAWIQAFGR